MTEPKLAKNMSPEEYKAKLAELRRGPPPKPVPPPVDPTKHARDLSAEERAEWLQAHKRKFR
jgi:hypothetical protein